jgi:hypothetical protein
VPVEGAVKVPLKAPVFPVVSTFWAVVHGPEVEVLYCRVTVTPFGTGVLADTDPEKATLVWPG